MTLGSSRPWPGLLAGVLALVVSLQGAACSAGKAGGSAAPARAGVEVSPLAGSVWLHTSYKTLPGLGSVRSNGLLVQTREGVFLVDTAWDDEQTREVASWSRSSLSGPIRFAIFTHAHDDKMGGVGALHGLGVDSTFALAQTNEAAVARGLVPARHALPFKDDVETLAGGEVEAFYPGPGHTPDNIVVYLKGPRVLFGGCLIRPGDSDSLGNTADAVVARWDGSVARVKARYPEARVVVPSHGPPGGPELLDHTIALVEQHRQQTAAPR